MVKSLREVQNFTMFLNMTENPPLIRLMHFILRCALVPWLEMNGIKMARPSFYSQKHFTFLDNSEGLF